MGKKVKTEEQLWFGNKLYGWGWTPATWQGWAVLLVWAVVAFSPFWILHAPLNKKVCTEPTVTPTKLGASQVESIQIIPTDKMNTCDEEKNIRRDALELVTLWVFLATVLLAIIAYKKGEKPRWRWGSKE